MQLPILKDGIVVNVIEIDEDAVTCSKAELKMQMLAEEAEHNAAMEEWRMACKAISDSVKAAVASVEKAREDAAAAIRRAEKGGDAKKALAAISAAQSEVEARTGNLEAVRATPLPEKPRLVRKTRWAVPEGFVVGSPGGSIGDTWNGREYVRPDQEAEDTKRDAKVKA